MIGPYHQFANMQANPLLARNIDETVNNLKNLEICIDQLRNDLVNVAEATGNLPAVQRLRTPAQLAASPAAATGAWSPFDIQRQLASPFAQGAVSPYGPHDTFEGALNPYAATSSLAPAQLQQIQQAQLQQLRLAELARQGAMSPFGTSAISPYSTGAVSPFSSAAVNPFSSQAISPYSTGAVSPFSSAAISPFSSQAINPFSAAAISPYSTGAVSPFSSAAINPFSSAAINPYSTGAVSPFSSAAMNPNLVAQQHAIAQRVPSTISQSPYAAPSALAGRQLGTGQITPGAVGPF